MIKRLIFLLFLAGGLTAGWQIRKEYLQHQLLLKKIAGVHSSASTLYFVHQDQLGSTSLITDATGAAVSSLAYYPYGSTRSSEGDSPTQRQYTGQISDTEETGLYYYNARYYHPAIGKFTQADTAGGYLNRYIYVGNNPINKIDPTGHDDWWRDELPPSATTDEANQYIPQIEASGVVGAQTLTTWVGGSGEQYPYPQNISGDPNDAYKFLATVGAFSFAAPAMAAGGGAAVLYEAVDTLTCLYTTGGDPMCAAGVLPGPNPVSTRKMISDDLLASTTLKLGENEGSSATMHLLDEQTVAKVFRYSDAEDIAYFNREYQNAKLLAELGVGPEVYQQIRTPSGRFGYTMEYLPGGFPDEVPNYITGATYKSLQANTRKVIKAGYEFGDPQYFVLPNGMTKFIDAGSLAPKGTYGPNHLWNKIRRDKIIYFSN